MSKFDQVKQMLYNIATRTLQLPKGWQGWQGFTPPVWLGVCNCAVWLSWFSCTGRRCPHCHKGYRRAPYMDVLLASWIIGGNDALVAAADGLFNNLPRVG